MLDSTNQDWNTIMLASKMPASTYVGWYESVLVFVPVKAALWMTYFLSVSALLMSTNVNRQSNFWFPEGTLGVPPCWIIWIRTKILDIIKHWASQFPAKPKNICVTVSSYTVILQFYQSLRNFRSLQDYMWSELCFAYSFKMWEIILRLFSALYWTNWSV